MIILFYHEEGYLQGLYFIRVDTNWNKIPKSHINLLHL